MRGGEGRGARKGKYEYQVGGLIGKKGRREERETDPGLGTR